MDFWLIGELALTGALVGLMYALVAVGIVLVYKTSGVANFAQGAIAMTGGYATWAIATFLRRADVGRDPARARDDVRRSAC